MRVLNYLRWHFRKYPAPRLLINIYLMLRWGCLIHLGADIGYPNKIRIGRRTRIGRCKIGGDISLGRSVVVSDGVTLASAGGSIVIGDAVSVQEFCVITGTGGVLIGRDTRIASHCVIVASNHQFSDPSLLVREAPAIGRGISIGADCWLGSHVCVLDGVTIGNQTCVGAGAVVTKPLPEAVIAIGNPAKVHRMRFDDASLHRVDRQLGAVRV